MAQPRVLVLVTDGSEELETVAIVDLLRRAHIKVLLVGVSDPAEKGAESAASVVTCSRGVRLLPDCDVQHILPSSSRQTSDRQPSPEQSEQQEVDSDLYDMIILPGGVGDGKGARQFAHDDRVRSLLKRYVAAKKWVACLCAAPVVLKAAGLFRGAQLTSHPSVKRELIEEYDYQESPVVCQSGLITSRGPGSVFPFVFTIIDVLLGPAAVQDVKLPLCLEE